MTINFTTEYAVFSLDKKILFQGTYQECLLSQSDFSEDTFVNVDNTPVEYELQDLPLEYNYED